nr:DNA cytosine methyltransferase [Deltaproteobacteria bacterium]
MTLRVLEICAGGGGQAVGLERAGFHHAAAVEIDEAACATLRLNRPKWNVLCADVRTVHGKDFGPIDLIAGGVPCPPFSVAGKQLGADDERDMFPEALRLIEEANPAAALLENVPGFASAKFDDYRGSVERRLRQAGYETDWRVLNASSFGVPQLRPRFVLVALKRSAFERFEWPEAIQGRVTVGECIGDLMASRGWPGAAGWAVRAADIGPTIVGGSKKHGGGDLGPTRARLGWAKLGVEGKSLAEGPPERDFPVDGMPRLSIPMVARIQGFPDEWAFAGKKTAAYRQVGNAFPPPVAEAVGRAIRRALSEDEVSPKHDSSARPSRRRARQLTLPVTVDPACPRFVTAQAEPPYSAR